MGGGLQQVCRCPANEGPLAELGNYGQPAYPGDVTRPEYDGGTGGQQPFMQQRPEGCRWCCPETDSGQAVGRLPASGEPAMSFAVPEKSNLDYVDNKQQGYTGQDFQSQNAGPAVYPDYRQQASPQQVLPAPSQPVNQQTLTPGDLTLAAQLQQGPRETTHDSHTGSISSNKSGGRTASEWAADQQQFAHLPPLPQGWLRVLSRSTGKIYYCYPETGETTFSEPTGPPPSKEAKNANLPPGWAMMVSRSTGRTYYWHAGLQKSQFDFPTAADSVGVPESGGGTNRTQSDSSLPDGWVQMVSRSTGKTYYFNSTTQQSQFEHP